MAPTPRELGCGPQRVTADGLRLLNLSSSAFGCTAPGVCARDTDARQDATPQIYSARDHLHLSLPFVLHQNVRVHGEAHPTEFNARLRRSLIWRRDFPKESVSDGSTRGPRTGSGSLSCWPSRGIWRIYLAMDCMREAQLKHGCRAAGVVDVADEVVMGQFSQVE